MVRSEVSLDGYVLNVIPQKENDLIVNILTEDGLKSVYGRGYAKPKSKYYILNNRFIKVKITGIDNKFFKLQDVKVLSFPNTKDLTISKYTEISKLISFFINTKEYQGEATYLLFNHLMEDIGILDVNHFADFFLVNTLNNLGGKYALDYCVKCQSRQNLVGFNFMEGGCVCHNCQTYEPSLTLEQFKAIYALFNLNINHYLHIKQQKFIQEELINLYEDAYGISMRKWRESGRSNHGSTIGS